VFVYVVRHACAGHKGDWPGPDTARPLDPVGIRQAEALVEVLGGRGVRRLLSSPTRRCIDTLEPLAGRLRLTVERSPRLAATGSTWEITTLVGDSDSAGAVLCTHGETMRPLLDHLRSSGAVLRGSESDEALLTKGTAWELDVRDGAVVSLVHRAPAVRPDCSRHPPPVAP
jgi:8-oxo-dGTP diphosphatase